MPSTPYDAKGMMISAIESEDPIIFMEPKRIYRAIKQEVSEEKFTLPLGKAKVLQEGSDVTVIAFDIYTSSVQSREKDYTDYFRTMTYHSLKEMEKVIGPLNDNSFLIELRNQTEDFTTRIKNLFDEFILN